MRKLVVLTFLSLDGVMQAPGGPEEDREGAFEHGGWSVGYFDDFLGQVMSEQMGHPFDLLLGRKTYDIFAAYWPKVTDDTGRGINDATKYVVSHGAIDVEWKGTVLLEGDVVAKIRELKSGYGAELQVHGSSNMIQTLWQNDLVDELWLKTFPVALGKGKRLFAGGTMPAGFSLVDSRVSPAGVVVANYARAGEVRVGSFELPAEQAADGDEPSGPVLQAGF